MLVSLFYLNATFVFVLPVDNHKRTKRHDGCVDRHHLDREAPRHCHQGLSQINTPQPENLRTTHCMSLTIQVLLCLCWPTFELLIITLLRRAGSCRDARRAPVTPPAAKVNSGFTMVVHQIIEHVQGQCNREDRNRRNFRCCPRTRRKSPYQ